MDCGGCVRVRGAYRAVLEPGVYFAMNSPAGLIFAWLKVVRSLNNPPIRLLLPPCDIELAKIVRKRKTNINTAGNEMFDISMSRHLPA